jgi:hypothetical protein
MDGCSCVPLAPSAETRDPLGYGHVSLLPWERAALHEAALRRRRRGERAPVKLGALCLCSDGERELWATS